LKVSLKFRSLSLVFLITTLILFSCKSAPVKVPVSGSTEPPDSTEQPTAAGGLAEEIRSLTESGRLSSMTRALELIQDRNLGGVDFGRVMNGVNTLLIRLIYPDSKVRLPALDLPQTHSYTRIIREAERGNYISPGRSTDFFEYVLPFFSLNNQSTRETMLKAIEDLEKAREMRPLSVLPPYLCALIYERIGQLENAETAYKQAYEISDECYPALAGIARIMRLSGRKGEAIDLFLSLVIRHPDSLSIKRQLAAAYYENGDWSRAGPAVDEILQNTPRDGEFILMKAQILIEQSRYTQAQTVLDSYASINPNNRLYLFLRARIQAEGNHNRDSALNYLRSIIRTNPDDDEVLLYTVSLLMESPRPADQAEGREHLTRLQRMDGSSITVQTLGLRDAIRRESWQEAQVFLNRILSVRRGVSDLVDAYNVEHGLGNNARALSYARELYDRDTSNNDYIAVYVSALIDNGRREEASRLIESRLAALGGGVVKSRFYFLRSRIQTNEDAELSDLRSSLFEDPRNLQALIAMFEIYHRRREERRAVYYLKQALAIAPDTPGLRRYEREYADLLKQ
jgi:tetratricopeptide (TPR) repeat protein